MKQRHWQDGVNLVLGLWIVIAPLVVSHVMAIDQTGAPSAVDGDVMWNFYLVGAGVAAVAAVALLAFQEWEEWTNLLLGGWLLISPWVLEFNMAAGLMWTALVGGSLVVLLAVWAMVPRSNPRQRA